MSQKPRILVTGAAGRNGQVAVMELLAKKFPVRAMVRRDDARAQRLRAAGAEIFVGDLMDYRHLEQALSDVQRAYYSPPVGPNLLHATMNFALAAEQAKLEVVALMSGWNPHASSPSAFTREHWISNNIFQWMPSVDLIHVNPGVFAFIYFLGLPAIVHLGKFMAPMGDGLNAPPSNEDIGAVAAGLIAEPKDRIGKCYRPTGPKLISPSDIAGIFGKVLGRKVQYQDVPEKTFAKAALASGVTEFELTNTRHYLRELRGGTFAIGAPTSHVEEICGRPAEDFETIARRYIAQPELVAPGFAIGSKFQTLVFVARMLMTRVPDLDRWDRDHLLPVIAEPVLAHDSVSWRQQASEQQLSLFKAPIAN